MSGIQTKEERELRQGVTILVAIAASVLLMAAPALVVLVYRAAF
jgi:hypothetical protein